MNSKQIITTNQDSKLTLQKSKNLFGITRKILDKKELIKSFLFKPFIMESGHTDRITTISISESKKYIISGSIDRTLKIWAFDTLECLCTFDNFNRVDLVKISPCENYIISEYCEEYEVCSNQIIKVWDIKNKECINSLEIVWENSRKFHRKILISPNSEYFILEFDNEIKIFNLLSGECLNSFPGYQANITPDSNFLFFMNANKLKKFNISQNEFFDICDAQYFITSVDKKYLIINKDEEINFLNYETNEYLFTIGEFECLILITIDENNKYVAALDADGTMKIWDVDAKECINTLNANANEFSYKQYGELRIPNTKYVALSEYNNSINIFNEKVVETLKINNHERYIVSRDNKHIVFGYDDGRIEIFNVEKNIFLGNQFNDESLVDLKLDKSFLILTHNSGSIKILNAKNNQYFAKFKLNLNCISSIHINFDENYIVIENYDKEHNKIIHVFDTKMHKVLRTISLGRGFYLLNHKYIGNIDMTNKEIKIFDLKTKECLFFYENNRIKKEIIISNDEKYLIMQTNLYEIGMFNFKTNELIKTFKTQSSNINLIKISTDSNHLIAISNNDNFEGYPRYETTVQIWNIKTAESIDILENELNNIISFDIIDDIYIFLGEEEQYYMRDNIKVVKIIEKSSKKIIDIFNYDLCDIDFKNKTIFCSNKYGLVKKVDIKTKNILNIIDVHNNISIDENGYFNADDENVEKYIRVSEKPLSQRKLTNDEINHFKK